MKSHRLVAAVLVVGALAGCSSLSSTYVGDAGPGTKFEGMPIVVQRPKYLKMTVKEVVYGVLANNTAVSGSGNTAARVEMLSTKDVIEVDTEVVSVGEVYTLDLKRPAAGTTEYAVEFETNSQFPKKVGAKIEDKTITELADALTKSVGAFKSASSGGSDRVADADVRRLSESIVSIELISLADPTAPRIPLYRRPGK